MELQVGSKIIYFSASKRLLLRAVVAIETGAMK